MAKDLSEQLLIIETKLKNQEYVDSRSLAELRDESNNIYVLLAESGTEIDFLPFATATERANDALGKVNKNRTIETEYKYIKQRVLYELKTAIYKLG